MDKLIIITKPTLSSRRRHLKEIYKKNSYRNTRTRGKKESKENRKRSFLKIYTKIHYPVVFRKIKSQLELRVRWTNLLNINKWKKMLLNSFLLCLSLIWIRRKLKAFARWVKEWSDHSSSKAKKMPLRVTRNTWQKTISKFWRNFRTQTSWNGEFWTKINDSVILWINSTKQNKV